MCDLVKRLRAKNKQRNCNYDRQEKNLPELSGACWHSYGWIPTKIISRAKRDIVSCKGTVP